MKKKRIHKTTLLDHENPKVLAQVANVLERMTIAIWSQDRSRKFVVDRNTDDDGDTFWALQMFGNDEWLERVDFLNGAAVGAMYALDEKKNDNHPLHSAVETSVLVGSDLARLSKTMGLNPHWVILRTVWDQTRNEYSPPEQTTDGKTWTPYLDDANVITIRYVGGPKDGRVEW